MRFPVVLLAILALLAACGEASSTSREEGSTTTSSSATPVVRTSETTTHSTVDDRSSAVEVIDGDTIEVDLAGGRETVRIIGVNAPERGECLADEATGRLRELVAGADIELVADESDRDQYGRLLRYVESDGTDVGAELVRAGLALAREYPPDTARSHDYELAQQTAEDADAGMWGPDACGAGGSTDAAVAIDATRFDADGDDNENLNDEWVRITNQGGGPVDLTGWVLKDTSASHRYPFPSGFVLGAGASVTTRTGCGPDSPTELHWCNEGSAVWNNSGDTAFLLDPAGNIVDSRDG